MTLSFGNVISFYYLCINPKNINMKTYPIELTKAEMKQIQLYIAFWNAKSNAPIDREIYVKMINGQQYKKPKK